MLARPRPGQSSHAHQFEFRIATALLTKPHSPSSTSSAAGRPEGRSPFLVPDPAFVVAPVGAAHVLELNLHSVLRPSFVLHTRLFRPQTEDLGPADVRAVRAVMARLEGPGARGATMMIFNCGVAAGCSQGHKHVQIFARPARGLFPDAAASADGNTPPPFFYPVLALRDVARR